LRANLYTILNSCTPKMLLWGTDFLTFYNDAYARLVQGGECLGLGTPYPQFRPGMWPRVKNSIEAALRGEGSVVQEFRTEAGRDDAPTGGVFQLCFSPLLDEDRNISGVLVDIFDVTARKTVEENLLGENALLNALFSTAPVLIAHATAPELRLRYVNAGLSRMLGDRPLIGRTVAEAIPEAEVQGFTRIIEEVLATGRPWEGREVPVRLDQSGEGGLRYLDFVYQPMPAADGTIGGILFSGYDVTDRRQAREESERLKHELLHSSRMSAMGTMAVTIAHELNQPLTAAANYLASAEYFLPGDERLARERESLRMAREQLLRAGNIVRRMRSLVSCGEARADAFDLRRSIARAVELVRASGNLNGFEVEVDVAMDARSATGDDVQVEQVLVNLLRNAALASAGSRRRAALLKAARDENGMILITLRDWGPGLPPERLENLFATPDEPGARGGSAKGPGLGVGLSLSRTIVEAHGGRIAARNCPDGGAIFSLTLPASGDEGPAVETDTPY
jgi:two-component system sensor kinase FixL